MRVALGILQIPFVTRPDTSDTSGGLVLRELWPSHKIIIMEKRDIVAFFLLLVTSSCI